MIGSTTSSREPGGWSCRCPAGFVMAGESAEQAVQREVAEEVDRSVDQLHYFGSQPWLFPRSLMLAFTAHVTNPEAMHPDGREIVAADWYTRDEARQAWADGTVDPPPPMSIAHRLMTPWLDGMPGRPVTQRIGTELS